MRDFANKRWIGGLNLLSNRGRQYQASVFEAMVADFNTLDLDHIVCTGDITNLALEQEFHFARELFDRIGLGSENVTVIPGNHDAYVAVGPRYFGEIFADYCQSDAGWQDAGKERQWPVVRVRQKVAIIGLTTSRKTPWFTAYGRLGPDQLARLRAVLTDPSLADKMRLVAIHHPPTGRVARGRVRGLRDFQAFADLIADTGAELILHGHEHHDLRARLDGPNGQGVDVLGIQSGTYRGHRPEKTARYRIFEIGDATDGDSRPRVAGHSLRKWDSETGAFVPDPGVQESTSEPLEKVESEAKVGV